MGFGWKRVNGLGTEEGGCWCDEKEKAELKLFGERRGRDYNWRRRVSATRCTTVWKTVTEGRVLWSRVTTWELYSYSVWRTATTESCVCRLGPTSPRWQSWQRCHDHHALPLNIPVITNNSRQLYITQWQCVSLALIDSSQTQELLHIAREWVNKGWSGKGTHFTELCVHTSD